MSIFTAIRQQDQSRVALQDKTQQISYGALMDEIEVRAAKLEGVSCLGLALDNSAEWVLWDLAALQAGIPCVPLPPFFTEEQVHHTLQSAGVSHLLSPHGMRDTGIIFQEGVLPAGTAKVTFTSGTTAAPKGVCLPLAAMENVARSIVKILGPEFSGIHSCVLPLAVLLENVAGVYAALMAGSTIDLESLRTLGKSYERLHDHLKPSQSNTIILVPEILRALMAQVASIGPLPALKFVAVGGSKVDPALVLQARSMGLPVYEGYGLSECASVVSLNTPRRDKPGSTGQILPHARVRIVEGEIQIKDPGFLGYIGEAAPHVFATGDLGSLDENGFLSVTGRCKNVLITSYGRNVSPEWVEAALLAQPSVAQALVYGDAEPHLKAFIVPTPSAVKIEEAVARANSGLPDYAQILDFQIVPPFTLENGLLTGNGRPRRESILTLYTKEKHNDLLRTTC